MMTTRRRLLAYAKQTTRANFTPAQRRRVLSKARHQAANMGVMKMDSQDAVDAIRLSEREANHQRIINEILAR